MRTTPRMAHPITSPLSDAASNFASLPALRSTEAAFCLRRVRTTGQGSGRLRFASGGQISMIAKGPVFHARWQKLRHQFISALFDRNSLPTSCTCGLE
jgi:hypothetical protein